MSKVIVLHDKFSSYGGQENVAMEIAKTLSAPLATTYIDKSLKEFENSGVEMIPFRQEKYMSSRYSKLYRNKVIESASIAYDFERINLSKFDIIFSSGVLSRGYIPTEDQVVINYIHSPPRWLYDMSNARMGNISHKYRFFAIMWANWWRSWNSNVNNYVDCYVASSSVVQKRIKKYLGRESIIVPPSIDISKYSNAGDDGYFLAIGELHPENRIEIMIEAFRKYTIKLKFIGVGDDKHYKKIAKKFKNVEFLGQVSEKEKIKLLSKCTGVIHLPTQEGFGIVPIEAFASGKPVIGIEEGFTKQQIVPGLNGFFLEHVTHGSLSRTIRNIREHNWDTKEIQKCAAEYDVPEFKNKIISLVEEYKG